MTPEEQYPSTDDCGLGHEDSDLVLVCITNARERYAEHHSRSSYAGREWLPNAEGFRVRVCAIGSIWIEGVDHDIYDEKDFINYLDRTPAMGRTLADAVEEMLRDEAKEAIQLVNEAAVELFPESADYDRWSGPLEYVNQSWAPDGVEPDVYAARYGDQALEEEVTAAVLSIYDRAAELRREQVPA